MTDCATIQNQSIRVLISSDKNVHISTTSWIKIVPMSLLFTTARERNVYSDNRLTC